MINHWTPICVLASLLGIAVWCDVARRRIPNGLVIAGLIAGGVLSFLASSPSGVPFAGVQGVYRSLLGAVAGLTVMLPLFLCRAMGAGDVKLMAAVGSFLGPVQVLGAALLAFAAGGVLSLVAALCSGTLKRVADNLRLMAMFALSGRPGGTGTVQLTGRLPYAVAIATGTGLQIWLATLASWPFK